MKDSALSVHSRRAFLRAAPVAGIMAIEAPSRRWLPAQAGEDEEEEGVSAGEDLMREHGILKRVLLVYDEIVRRVDAKQEIPRQAAIDAAEIIRKFIENYHEKLEEEHLFPRFRRAGRLVELVDTLEAQHHAGRRLTERIVATAASLKTEDERRRLAHDLLAFNRMYAPHEAREDTVLFPELHKIVTRREYDAMGDQLEGIERKTFGGHGFDIYVEKVAAVEKQLGIYDLRQFTPR
jgi:hemerythrin-like domain-containing protein